MIFYKGHRIGVLFNLINRLKNLIQTQLKFYFQVLTIYFSKFQFKNKTSMTAINRLNRAINT